MTVIRLAPPGDSPQMAVEPSKTRSLVRIRPNNTAASIVQTVPPKRKGQELSNVPKKVEPMEAAILTPKNPLLTENIGFGSLRFQPHIATVIPAIIGPKNLEPGKLISSKR
jgi:hypothetical protein